jgi:hypothetical protein
MRAFIYRGFSGIEIENGMKMAESLYLQGSEQFYDNF